MGTGKFVFMDNKPELRERQVRWGGWRWALVFYWWEWQQILYVTSCSTLPGHLQVQGMSGRRRPHSFCLAMDTSGPGLPVAQRSTSEISLSVSDAPLEGWITYWASFRFNIMFKVASIHIIVKSLNDSRWGNRYCRTVDKGRHYWVWLATIPLHEHENSFNLCEPQSPHPLNRNNFNT